MYYQCKKDTKPLNDCKCVKWMPKCFVYFIKSESVPKLRIYQ